MNIEVDMEETRAERFKTAAEWLLTLQDAGLSHEQYLDWERWMEQGLHNQQAFDEVQRLSGRTTVLQDKFRDIPLPPSAEMAADEYTGEMPVSNWLNRCPADAAADNAHKNRSSHRRWQLALAAAVSGVAIALSIFVATGIPDHVSKNPVQAYETAKSEHREITLEDGSVINLGARSSLSVNYTTDRRAVVLEEGEALFTVARNPERPFVVIAGSGTITAVGTAFNVRRNAARVVVTVTDGKVEVEQQNDPSSSAAIVPSSNETEGQTASATVSVGEQVVYNSTGIVDVKVTDLEVATSWQSGQLQFRSEPLKYVIKGVNRYSAKEVIIVDESVENYVFTGTVFQDQADDWLKGLEDVFPVEVVNVGGNKVLVRTGSVKDRTIAK